MDARLEKASAPLAQAVAFFAEVGRGPQDLDCSRGAAQDRHWYRKRIGPVNGSGW